MFSIPRLYGLLGPRAYTVMMFSAIFFTLTVKFFHSYRTGLINEYFGWILADIAVLLGIEVILALVCFRWPRSWIIRVACVVAAVVCTWSVINAGWVIRSGMQILPTVFVSLFLDPVTSLVTIITNIIDMKVVGLILLLPAAIAIVFFFFVLAKPLPPLYNRKPFATRIIVCVMFILIAILSLSALARRGSPSIASAGLHYNSQLKAVKSLFSADPWRLTRVDLVNAKRKIPTFDQVRIPLRSEPKNYNIIIIILEGVQYRKTSLWDRQSNLTPYLADLARHGAEFTNFRSSLTHTTKALFGLLTGRFPSAFPDIAEAVPAVKPYASMATILEGQLNFRTAFFQSAKGNFESRPSLVSNLGFDKFWSREDLNDLAAFLGYLGSDEFLMVEPIVRWIKSEDKPFFLTVLCSVSHNPYEVPEWFATPFGKPIERYKQTIYYTDKFIAELDSKLTELNLEKETIFCVVGDHGEAFGEHGMFGHIRIAFEELLHIPLIIRAPSLVRPETRVTETVSSIDLAPTLLALLGFDANAAGFDGINALATLPNDRKVFFSGWLQESPAGFVIGNRKFLYSPTDKTVSLYDLNADPHELIRIELPGPQAQRIASEIITWRKNSIFQLDQERAGRKIFFDSWQCRWINRLAWAKHYPDEID
ncbi:MAG: sulfatase-like hydrolase/transferase [Candidatus Aminicenantes bacterium]|nr:sulfatase-like hydrolase/transferase [Candidatus Aminicenantes bacterium]